jgi:tRNA A37 methylthiotransferase MiaB
MTEEQKKIFDNFENLKKDSIYNLVLLSQAVRSFGFDQSYESLQDIISKVVSDCSFVEDSFVEFQKLN